MLRRILAVAVLAALSSGDAQAQTGARNGDVSGGLDHQPTRTEVQSREKNAGVVAPQAAQRQQDRDVDQLYDKLTGQPRPGAEPSGK